MILCRKKKGNGKEKKGQTHCSGKQVNKDMGTVGIYGGYMIV